MRALAVSGVQMWVLLMLIVPVPVSVVTDARPLSGVELSSARLAVKVSVCSTRLSSVAVTVTVWAVVVLGGSGERRVGEEGRLRWVPDQLKKKERDAGRGM